MMRTRADPSVLYGEDFLICRFHSEERRMLFTVLCQDQLPVTGTQILRGPHEEDLSSSTALPLLLSLLQPAGEQR
ncbi:hypothetical protein GBAR_LOCUS23086, partial [Geodia barretti]